MPRMTYFEKVQIPSPPFSIWLLPFLVCHLTDTTKAELITLPLIYLSVIDLENLEHFDRVAGTERLARGNGIDKILFGELSGETGSVAAAVPRLDADERSIESGRRP